MADKLQLIAAECGLGDARLISRTRRAELYRARATDASRAGEVCSLKIIRGPRAYLTAHDRLLDRVMSAQVMASLASARNVAASRGGALPVMAHGRYAFADGDELLYQVSPWIEGAALQDLLRMGALDAEAIASPARLGLARLVAEAVVSMAETVPGCTLVHRDLRPSNLVVADKVSGGPDPTPADAGEIVDYSQLPAAPRRCPLDLAVIDLDAALLLDGPGRPSRSSGETAERDGRRLAPGTPGYASPEEIAEGPGAITDRADVYALGVVIHQVLTGGWPYPFTPAQAADPELVPAWLGSGGRPRPSDALPADLRELLGACLEVDPLERPSLREVLRRLREAGARGSGESARQGGGGDPNLIAPPPRRIGRAVLETWGFPV